MKLKDLYTRLQSSFPDKIKIIKKGIFWIIFEEEAFFMAKFFNFKISSLDKNTIKIGFPDGSKNKWLKILEDKNLGYILVEQKNLTQPPLGEGEENLLFHLSKREENLFSPLTTEEENLFLPLVKGELEGVNIVKINNGSYYNSIYSINLEDFNLTKDRILGLKKLYIEDKNEKNFLLQNKLEDLYILLSSLLIRLPKKERFYFRDKIERIFLDILEMIYKYKYNLEDRKILINDIFSKSMILREYCRLLHNIGKIKNDNVYIDIGDRWLEILKICKGIKNKNL